jgi:hypothetical protein
MTYIPGYACPRCGYWVGESQTHSCNLTVGSPASVAGWACTSSGHEFYPFRDWGVIYCRKCGETRTISVPAAKETPPDDDTEPDPNRKGMPKCPRCGDIAFRPDPVDWRKPAWRCGGCHRVLGRCNCAALAAAKDGTLVVRQLSLTGPIAREDVDDFYGGVPPEGREVL